MYGSVTELSSGSLYAFILFNTEHGVQQIGPLRSLLAVDSIATRILLVSIGCVECPGALCHEQIGRLTLE